MYSKIKTFFSSGYRKTPLESGYYELLPKKCQLAFMAFFRGERVRVILSSFYDLCLLFLQMPRCHILEQHVLNPVRCKGLTIIS
jgi:hypothetical protein